MAKHKHPKLHHGLINNNHHHHHHHHHEVNEKSVGYLMVSFVINMLLSVIEIVAGIVGGSVALIGDALHNMSDAFSILIAVLAFRIGRKRANDRFTYGFRRAEVIGAFVNLILLMVAGVYLLTEGVIRLIVPEPIDGWLIVGVSVVALVVDGITAKISHSESHNSENMRMVFLHNLADALGSVGVIVSGLCVVWFDMMRIDGVVALLIAGYMIFQSVKSFPKIVNILMNAAPEDIDLAQIKKAICGLPGIKGVHHVHVWSVNEHDVALECHIVADEMAMVADAAKLLNEKFGIRHSNIQIENLGCGENCDL